jgi:hypothetical protein
MQVEISYEEAAARYPKQVAEIIANLRKGKSVQKNADPSALSYTLDWGERIQAYTFNDLMQGKETRSPEPNSFEQYWEGVKSRIPTISLRASIKRWWGWADTHITEHPQEVHDFYRTAYEREQQETARYANLSPLQKRQELENALKNFSGVQVFLSSSIKGD